MSKCERCHFFNGEHGPNCDRDEILAAENATLRARVAELEADLKAEGPCAWCNPTITHSLTCPDRPAAPSEAVAWGIRDGGGLLAPDLFIGMHGQDSATRQAVCYDAERYRRAPHVVVPLYTHPAPLVIEPVVCVEHNAPRLGCSVCMAWMDAPRPTPPSDHGAPVAWVVLDADKHPVRAAHPFFVEREAMRFAELSDLRSPHDGPHTTTPLYTRPAPRVTEASDDMVIAFKMAYEGWDASPHADALRESVAHALSLGESQLVGFKVALTAALSAEAPNG